jgi:glyoxylase-like metal-dependent hydrolase (beta-lactamase superfamily II)
MACCGFPIDDEAPSRKSVAADAVVRGAIGRCPGPLPATATIDDDAPATHGPKRSDEDDDVKLQQVSASCFAVRDDGSRIGHANSGLVARDGGMVIDTQSDLPRARRMAELLGSLQQGMPRYVINTSGHGDHVSGNPLFAGAEIVAHRAVPDGMRQAAVPAQRLAPAATLFDDRYAIDLGGLEVQLIHVGPCQWTGDTIVHVPREGVVFAGDVVYRECTPMGWQGSSEKWLQGLDLIVWLDPEVIVPGHGRPCGIEGAMEMKAYLEHVRDESRWCFERGQSALEAAKEIELGPYRAWRWPARLYANVASAYREFRNEAAPVPANPASDRDAMVELAKARGLEVEF